MTGKPSLILLPGMLCDAALWRHQEEALAGIADIHVGDLSRDSSIEGMARRILDAAPVEFSLAGLSMGGYVAQEIMRIAPGRVARLALIDTSARGDTPEQAEQRRSFLRAAHFGTFKGVTKRLLPSFIHPDRLADEVLCAEIMAMGARAGHEVYIAQQTAILGRKDGRADLAAITCPTLVLCGAEDILTPPKIHREIAEGIPGASYVEIPECGHLSPLEQPEAVSGALRRWLTDSGPSA